MPDSGDKGPNNGDMHMHVRFARPPGSNDPIYFIGPFGSRVSFESQQKRALYIVGSLLGLGHIKPLHKVAVVGAGLAGLMATLALSARGQHVELFEASEGPLTLQAGAFHRFIHPSVNFWPIHDAVRTTRLPFLDWYSADGRAVIETLTRQWVGPDDGHVRGFDSEEVKPLVSYLNLPPHYGHRMKLERFEAGKVVMSALERTGEFEFDVVLLAMGFGVEETFDDPDQKAYWNHDFLEQRARNPGQHIIVSGTGDGGLIDCLRLVYSDFRKGDFPLTVIKRLEEGKFETRSSLREIENQAPAGPDLAARATYFEAKYEELIAQLKPDLKRWLWEHLLRTDDGDYPNRIELVSPLPAPYETTAAVINRFLLAFALKQDALIFRPGLTISRAAGQYVLKSAAGDETVPKSTRVIIRHGPKQALAGFIDDASQEKEFKFHQLGADSYTSEASFPISMFVPEDSKIPSLAHYPDEYALSRLPVALNFVFDRYAHAVELEEDADGRPVYQMTGLPESLSRSLDPIATLPETVFGVKLEPPSRNANSSRTAFGARPSK